MDTYLAALFGQAININDGFTKPVLLCFSTLKTHRKSRIHRRTGGIRAINLWCLVIGEVFTSNIRFYMFAKGITDSRIKLYGRTHGQGIGKIIPR